MSEAEIAGGGGWPRTALFVFFLFVGFSLFWVFREFGIGGEDILPELGGCGNKSGFINHSVSIVYPELGRYQNNTNCVWQFHRPPGMVVKFIFSKIDLEARTKSQFCVDRIELVEWPDRVVHVLCGRSDRSATYSMGSKWPELRFTSDDSVQMTGFRVAVKFVARKDPPFPKIENAETFENGVSTNWVLEAKDNLSNMFWTVGRDRSNVHFLAVQVKGGPPAEPLAADILSLAYPASNQQKCIRFQFHTRNSFISLQVFLQEDNSPKRHLLWQCDGLDNGLTGAIPEDAWAATSIPVSLRTRFRVSLRAVARQRNRRVGNYFAIDNLSISNVTCAQPKARGRMCGLRPETGGLDSKIYGGHASVDSWPWLARLLVYNSPTGEPSYCSATLVSDQLLLTAEHCVSDDWSTEVMINEFDVDSWDFRQRLIIPNETIRLSGGYEGDLFLLESVDVVLLRLPYPLTLTRWLMPICLPDADDYAAGAQRTVGWGRDPRATDNSINLLQEVELEVTECPEGLDASHLPMFEFCTSSAHKDVCKGDSGSPLMVQREGIWHQMGVVSRGSTCPETTFPGYHVSVPTVVDWIKKVRDDSETFPS